MVQKKRVFRLKKGLFRETYPIKEFTFELSIEYQSFKLIAELSDKERNLVYSRKNEIAQKSSGFITNTFYPIPDSQTCQKTQQSFFSLILKSFSKFIILHNQVLNKLS